MFKVYVSNGDRTIAAQFNNLPNTVAFYEDVVPRDAAELHSWLARATNAVVAHDRAALTWR